MTTLSFADVKAYAADVYDVEKRPELVKGALTKLGVETVLSKVGVVNGTAEKVLDIVAEMSTVAGLMEKKDTVMEIAAPYIAKAKDAEGRKEIYEEIKALETVVDATAKVTEVYDEKKEAILTVYSEKKAIVTEKVDSTKALITEKVVEPVTAKIEIGKGFAAAKYEAGKELAAPYIEKAQCKAAPYLEKGKELADPYVAKLIELKKSERVESMIAAFQSAREHPAEKVGELKNKAIDLIKYENLKKYREHIMSEEFQADTIQLVKVDLPALAADKFAIGKESVKATAITMKEEMDKYSAKVASMVPTEEELKAIAEKVKDTGAVLLVELQAELSSGVEHVKTEGFSLDDTIDRLKRVVALVDKMVVTPLIEKVKPTGTASTTSSEEGEEDQEMEDALEDAPVSFATSMGSKSAVAATVLASSVAVAVSMSLCDNMAELCEHQ